MCCEGKTTLEKGGKDPPNVSLEYIVNDLLTYFNEFKSLDNAKTDAEVKYGINNEHDNCWPADDIKRAWGKTQRLRKTSCSRRLWALVIMLQVIQKQQAGNSSQGCAELSVNDSPDQMKARKRREIGEDDLGSTGDIDQDLGITKRRKEHPEVVSSTEFIYIRVPLSEMIPIEREQSVENVRSDYKLIAAVPETGNPSNEIRRRKSYVMSFNRDTMNANWVYEILNKDTVPENPVERATFGETYDRGHLAAAANQKWCCEALDDANMIDNIVPQHQGLNRGLWKTLEYNCRSKAKSPNIRNVHVYSGPLYKRDMNPQRIQWKRVPSHFFKVIIVENMNGRVNKPQYYLFPNQNLRGHPGQENEDILELYKVNNYGNRDERDNTIKDRFSELRFIHIGPNAAAREITGTLHGEDENAGPRTAEIQVTICY